MWKKTWLERSSGKISKEREVCWDMNSRKRFDGTIMVGENLLGEVWLQGAIRTTNPPIGHTTFTEEESFIKLLGR